MQVSFSFSQLYKDIRWFVLLNAKTLTSSWLGICCGIGAGMVGIRMSHADMESVAGAMGSMFFCILFITPFFVSVGLNKRHKLRMEVMLPSSPASKYMARLVGISVLSVVALSLTMLVADIIQYVVYGMVLHQPSGFATAIIFSNLLRLPDSITVPANFIVLPATILWFAHSLQLVFTFFFKRFGVAFFCWVALWVGIIVLVVGSDSLQYDWLWLQHAYIQWAFSLLFALLASANYYWGYKLYSRIQLLNRKYLF